MPTIRSMTAAAAVGVVVAIAASGARAEDFKDPAKQHLAHEVMEASGGQARFEQAMYSAFDQMQKLMAGFLPSDRQDLIAVFQESARAEMGKLAPAALASSEQVYADELTTQELSDLLAWTRSASGRSIAAKSVGLQAHLIQAQTPMIRAMMVRAMRTSFDRICDLKNCTAEERGKVQALLEKVAPPSGG